MTYERERDTETERTHTQHHMKIHTQKGDGHVTTEVETASDSQKTSELATTRPKLRET